MANINFFTTETIAVPIGFRLLVIALLSLSQTIGKIFGYVGSVFSESGALFLDNWPASAVRGRELYGHRHRKLREPAAFL